MAAMTIRRHRGPLALSLAAALVLAGCSGDAEQSGAGSEGETSASPSATETSEAPYLPVSDDTELTPMGEELTFGDKATVAYQPRKGKVGVVDLTVTKVKQADIKDLVAFKLDKQSQKATPYYVTAKVKNVGDTNLTGTLPPLYVEDEASRLVQPSQFKSVFKPCASTPLPKGFKPGKQTTACWVYLVIEGKGQGVSYYPVEQFEPIVWTGDIAGADKKGKKGAKKGQQDSGQGSGQDDGEDGGGEGSGSN